MTTYEKFEKVREHISDDDLLNHFLQWLPTDTMDECLNDAIKDSDLEYFFPEEFGSDEDEEDDE